MRKYTRIGTFLLALVMCLTMLTAQAESELPEEVADLFTVKAWAHYAIANQPDMPENKAFAVMQEKSGYEAALLVMRNTKSETNVLVLAEKSSAQADWKITMRNWGAVEQGDANVPQLAVLPDGRFVIHYPNGDSAYFTHEANGWQLTNLSFGDTTQVEVSRSGMTFLTLSDNGKWVKTSVSGVVETAMAQFSMDRFPRTVAAAREHLTNPPTIPDSPWSWTYPYGFPQPSQYAKLAASSTRCIPRRRIPASARRTAKRCCPRTTGCRCSSRRTAICLCSTPSAAISTASGTSRRMRCRICRKWRKSAAGRITRRKFCAHRRSPTTR